MSTVQDKDMWSLTFENINSVGTTIYNPHYDQADANFMVFTEDVIIREFSALRDINDVWGAQLAFVKFELIADNTEVLVEQINRLDGDRDDIHIYKIGSTLNPIILKKEQLLHMKITTNTAGSATMRFHFGAWGTWLRDAE